MVSRNEKIGVACWVDNIFVSLPLHLKRQFSCENILRCGCTVNEGKKKEAVRCFYLDAITHTKRPNVDVKLKGSRLHHADFAVHYPLSAVLTWCMFDLCGC